MAFKIDKQMLLKHRFWVMLGVAAVLTLGGIGYLEVFVDAEEAQKTLETALKQAKNARGTANQASIKIIQDAINEDAKKEGDIWSKAYAEEAPLFRWPKAVEDRYNFANGYFALEIKLSQLPPAKDWPKDVDDKDKGEKFIHGTFVDPPVEDRFFLKRANGTQVLICPIQTDAVKVITEDGKSVQFEDLKKVAAKKLLTIKYQKGRYFNDPLTLKEQQTFADPEAYKAQILKILQMVDPLDEKGNGVVQLKDWLFKPELPDKEFGATFIRWVTDEDWKVGNPIYRECWIAQEDVWIQREIYRMIAAANKKISNFTGEGGPKKGTAYTFQNPNFQVELTLDAKDSLIFKIKNRLDHQQALDLSFRVWLDKGKDAAPEVFRISGDPLKPAGDKAGKDSFTAEPFKVEKMLRTGVVKVQQVLTWQTAAVKRIDQVSIGDASEKSHSHRTFGDAKLRAFDPKDMENATAVNVPKKVLKGGPNKGKPATALPPPIAGGLTPIATASGNMGGIEHGLWTFRYAGDGVTDQFRRVPVAVVLIVDQDHVDRVLESFNNSKLRFLPTQVSLNQYPGSLQPPPLPGKDSENPTPPPVPTKGRPAPPPPPPTAATNDAETNMEMVIYGMMTLYQRYPPMPPKPVVPPKS